MGVASEGPHFLIFDPMNACRDCKFFTPDRRDPLYPNLELYICYSCPYALWINGCKRCYSSQLCCRHFVSKPLFVQLTLFEYD